MSEAILTTSEMGKPDASCVVPTLGAVVAVLTDGYWYGTGIRVPGYPFQYPSGTRVFKYPKVRALVASSTDNKWNRKAYTHVVLSFEHNGYHTVGHGRHKYSTKTKKAQISLPPGPPIISCLALNHYSELISICTDSGSISNYRKSIKQAQKPIAGI